MNQTCETESAVEGLKKLNNEIGDFNHLMQELRKHVLSENITFDDSVDDKLENEGEFSEDGLIYILLTVLNRTFHK